MVASRQAAPSGALHAPQPGIERPRALSALPPLRERERESEREREGGGENERKKERLEDLKRGSEQGGGNSWFRAEPLWRSGSGCCCLFWH